MYGVRCMQYEVLACNESCMMYGFMMYGVWCGWRMVNDVWCMPYGELGMLYDV